MVFLDAHCECVQGWLEALISPIVERRTTVPAPIIDVIVSRWCDFTLLLLSVV